VISNPPAALAKCPALYKEVTGLASDSPYRRIGADWDGDPDRPMVGVSTAYKGNTVQPDGSPRPSPAPSGINLSSSGFNWKVYGPSTTGGAPNAGGVQTYPHPLVSALSA